MRVTMTALGLSGVLALSPGEKDHNQAFALELLGGSRLGVGIAEVDEDGAAKFKLPEARGAVVRDVEVDSPAERAGLQKDDVLWEWRGEPVHGARQLRRLIQETPPGREVEMAYYRAGSLKTGPVRLDEGRREPSFHFEMPDFDMAWSPAVEGLQDRVRERLSFHRRARLGVSVLPLTGQLAEHLGAKDGGLLVSEVEEESAAAKAGIRAGDVIQRVNGRRIEEVGDLNEELRRAAERDGVATLDLVRDRGAISVTAEIESPEPVRKRGRRM